MPLRTLDGSGKGRTRHGEDRLHPARGFLIAISTLSTRLICPAPDATSEVSWRAEWALLLTWRNHFHPNEMSYQSHLRRGVSVAVFIGNEELDIAGSSWTNLSAADDRREILDWFEVRVVRPA